LMIGLALYIYFVKKEKYYATEKEELRNKDGNKKRNGFGISRDIETLLRKMYICGMIFSKGVYGRSADYCRNSERAHFKDLKRT
jgi:hypothetical protein